MFKKIIKNFLKLSNYEVLPKESWYKKQENYISEISDEEQNLIKSIKDYSMCSVANHWAIIQSIKHVFHNSLEGDFVEAGVFKGGNLIIMNHFLKKYNLDKNIFAYDTYDGMPDENINFDYDLKNEPASKIRNRNNNKWCYSSLEEVKKNISKFDKDFQKNFKFIIGKVENTLQKTENIPDKISLLRLDTDFYESTKIELELLYPRLVKNGILIIDDYGHWKGAKKAVDEYFDNKNFLFLHRIDYSSRLLVKS